MGRHSNGQKNNRLSVGLIAAIIAVLIIIALVVGWFRLLKNSEESTEQAHCQAGTLTVPVVAETGLEDLTQGLIDTYNSAKPIVRDHCVTATLSFDLTTAAAYVSSRSDGSVHTTLEADKRSAATLEWPAVASLPVGVAAPTGTTVDVAALNPTNTIAYTPGTHALVAALVAAKVSNLNTEEMTTALSNAEGVTVGNAVAADAELITVTENQTPANYTFHRMDDLVLPVRAVALNATEGVNEELVRAGADFATAMTDPAVATTVANIAAAEVLHGIVDAPAEPTAAALGGQVGTTLFLLDTSDVIGGPADENGTWFGYASTAIAESALAIGGAGYNVGLWNYSSPLSPGVVNGYRSNLYLGTDPTGQRTATAVRAFGYGGEPQTRSALYAAVSHAIDFAAVINQPVTVVLVSSGTVDEQDEHELSSLLSRMAAGNVTVKVVEMGTANPSDTALVAATGGTVVNNGAALSAAIKQAVLR